MPEIFLLRKKQCRTFFKASTTSRIEAVVKLNGALSPIAAIFFSLYTHPFSFSLSPVSYTTAEITFRDMFSRNGIVRKEHPGHQNVFIYLAHLRKKDTNFRMYSQRRAKIHLLVPVQNFYSASIIPSLELSEYKKEVEILRNDLLTYGIYVKVTLVVPRKYYVFTRMTIIERKRELFLDFPSPEWVSARVQALPRQATGSSFHVLVAETMDQRVLQTTFFRSLMVQLSQSNLILSVLKNCMTSGMFSVGVSKT